MLKRSHVPHPKLQCLSTLPSLMYFNFVTPFWSKEAISFQPGGSCGAAEPRSQPWAASCPSSPFTACVGRCSPSAQPVWPQGRRLSSLLRTGVFCTWSKRDSQVCCRDQAACGWDNDSQTQQTSKAQENSGAPQFTLWLLHFSHLSSLKDR